MEQCHLEQKTTQMNSSVCALVHGEKETLSDNFHGAKEILLDNFAFILDFGQKISFIVHSSFQNAGIEFLPNWNQCECVFRVGEGRDLEKTNLYKNSVEIVLRWNIPG